MLYSCFILIFKFSNKLLIFVCIIHTWYHISVDLPRFHAPLWLSYCLVYFNNVLS